MRAREHMTKDEQINDGLAGFDSGDYIFVYDDTVTEPVEDAATPSSG